MKQTITEYDFIQGFIDYDRTENFSYEGRKALFEYFEELEEDCGIEIEYDVIAICCDYSEDHWEDIKANYGFEGETVEDVLEELRYNTSVVALLDDDETIVYQVY